MIGQLLALSNTAHWENIAFALISLLLISCCYGLASLASTEMELAPEDFRLLKLLWDDYDKSIDQEDVREDLKTELLMLNAAVKDLNKNWYFSAFSAPTAGLLWHNRILKIQAKFGPFTLGDVGGLQVGRPDSTQKVSETN